MKNMKKALSLVLALVMCLSMLPVSVLAAEPSTGWNGGAATEFATVTDENGKPKKGNGTETSPHLIATAEQLALMAEKVNSKESGYSSAYYALVNDIDLAKKQWTPIGQNSYSPFSGYLIGNGHTISNLTIESNDSDMMMGLFGYITNGAEICNLTIDNAKIVNTSAETYVNANKIYAAVFVGSAQVGTKLCNVHAVNSTVTSGGRAGGIVGAGSSCTVCCSSIEKTKVTNTTTSFSNVFVPFRDTLRAV